MIGNQELNSVWVFEEDLNQLKWWTLCTPLVKPVRGDWRATRARSLASPSRGRGRAVQCDDVECNYSETLNVASYR